MSIPSADDPIPFGPRTVSPRGDIRLNIGELVLHGFPATNRHRVADALTRELTTLLGENGLPPHWRGADPSSREPTARLEIPPDCSPELLGRAIARALTGGPRT